MGLGDEAVLAGWIGTGVAGPGTKMGWGLTASLYPDLDGSTAAIPIGRWVSRCLIVHLGPVFLIIVHPIVICIRTIMKTINI